MYYWRRLTGQQREEILKYRFLNHQPFHSPPLMFQYGMFHISAACFDHIHHIGLNPQRMSEFSNRLINTMSENGWRVLSWVVLPNHYHLLVETANLRKLRYELGRLHGCLSREWNIEENSQGRKVWHRCSDRKIRNERHFWATINYINNNPVHHGYVSQWQDWSFSSAEDYLRKVGKEQVVKVWKEYPVMNYGAGWDDKNI